MESIPENLRGPRPQSILWQWTGISAVLHVAVITALCGVSYLGFAKREAASKAKAAVEEAVAKKAEADEAAKATPSPVNTGAPEKGTPAEKTAAAEKAPSKPPTEPAVATPATAEKILGIDQTAKPGEVPKCPFGGNDDDLLKDLK
jgi:hypothetical protein